MTAACVAGFLALAMWNPLVADAQMQNRGAPAQAQQAHSFYGLQPPQAFRPVQGNGGQATNARPFPAPRMRQPQVAPASYPPARYAAPANYDGDIAPSNSQDCGLAPVIDSSEFDGNCDSGTCDSGTCDGGQGYCDGGYCDNNYCGDGSMSGNLFGGAACAAGGNCQPKIWFGADWLLYQTSGMKIPALVTGNPFGTPINQAGVIGFDSTTVLLGKEHILEDARSGMRFNGGFWIGPCQRMGVEFEYFKLLEETYSAQYDSTSTQIIGRPFINLSPLFPPVRYDTQLVVYPPGQINGFVRVEASSELEGTAGRVRWNLIRDCGSCCLPCGSVCGGGAGGGCTDSCGGGCGNPCGGGCGGRCCSPRSLWADMTIGHRYMSLRERLSIYEQLTSPGDFFEIEDRFLAESRFNGIELGMEFGMCRRKLSFDVFGRCALGVNQNTVDIFGSTMATTGGSTSFYNQGILAQNSNIGEHVENVASMASEVGLNLGYRLARNLTASVGYSFLYWGNVVRSGEQIDTHISTDLFPPTNVPSAIGAERTHKMSDFFAHGLNVGLALTF